MQAVSIFFSQLNLLDYILLFVLFLSAIEGYATGVVVAIFDLIKFITSFIVGLKYYGFVAGLLVVITHISKGYANALGFFLLAFLIEVLLHVLLQKPLKNVNESRLLQGTKISILNNLLGIFPGMLSGMVFLMFILTVIITLPITPFLKNTVSNSVVGSFLVSRSQVVEQQISGIFGPAAEDTMNFLTIEPKDNTSVSLGFTTTNVQIDPQSENQMLVMVNNERTSRGFSPLVMDQKLQELARDYGKEMLARGYFSHYTPEGLSPFDRMTGRDIVFTSAGENLAFSPNVMLAIQGLMNSPGHRANILSPDFHNVGIGVIDAGIYGEMFVQDFTN